MNAEEAIRSAKEKIRQTANGLFGNLNHRFMTDARQYEMQKGLYVTSKIELISDLGKAYIDQTNPAGSILSEREKTLSSLENENNKVKALNIETRIEAINRYASMANVTSQKVRLRMSPYDISTFETIKKTLDEATNDLNAISSQEMTLEDLRVVQLLRTTISKSLNNIQTYLETSQSSDLSLIDLNTTVSDLSKGTSILLSQAGTYNDLSSTVETKNRLNALREIYGKDRKDVDKRGGYLENNPSDPVEESGTGRIEGE